MNTQDNYPSVMIDIETMGVKPNCKVLSISAVGFNEFDKNPKPETYPMLDLLLSLEDQANRTEDQDTIWWWSKREPEVIEKIFAEQGRIPLDEALNRLTKFCWQRERIWCQGPTLDATVLTHLYEERNKGVPWPYNIVRDSRTLLDLVEVEQPPVTHDSIQDCFRQVIGVQQAIKKLGIKKFIRVK